jgi:hypothetical protein
MEYGSFDIQKMKNNDKKMDNQETMALNQAVITEH